MSRYTAGYADHAHHLERRDDASRVESVRSISTRHAISASASTECVTTYAKQHIDIVNTDAYSNAVPHEGITTPQRIISSSAATRVTFDGRTSRPSAEHARGGGKGTLVQVLHEQE